MIKPLPTIFLRVIDIEPSYDYTVDDVICNIFHRNQHVAGVVIDDLNNTFKITPKTEFEKIKFELRSLLDDERVIGTSTFSYDFIKRAVPGNEYMQRIYLHPLGEDLLTDKDWGVDTNQTPNIEIGIEVEDEDDFGHDVPLSSTSRNMAPINDRVSYVGDRAQSMSSSKYVRRTRLAEPAEARAITSKNYKRHLSPNHSRYDTGVRIDGTQQSIVTKSSKRSLSSKHIGRGSDNLGSDGFELRGTRPSKFTKVRSSRSIKVTQDTPQHREQLKVTLKRLISQLDNKHEDLLKDTENRLKILDWLFKNKTQYDNLYGSNTREISEQETLVSEVDREYGDIHKRDQDDLYYIRDEIKRLEDELAHDDEALHHAKLRHEELLKFFGRSDGDDLEILEEEIEEDASGNVTNKKLINRYVRRTDKDIQEIRDQNQSLFKELQGIRSEIRHKLLGSQSSGIGSGLDGVFSNVQMKLNGATGAMDVANEGHKALLQDYNRETQKGINLNKKKIETENEVITLREFVANDRELKKRLEDASARSRKPGAKPSSRVSLSDAQKTLYNLQREKTDLDRQYKSNLDRIKSLENSAGKSGEGLGGLDRLFKRYQNSINQRNDLQSNLVRSIQANVHTVDVKNAQVGNPADDKRVLDLIDKVESKEKEVNGMLDLKEDADRKRRVNKKKNELSFNLNKDISELDKKVNDIYRDSEQLKIDAKNNRNLDVELDNKEARIQQQEEEIDDLKNQIDELNNRLSLEAGPDSMHMDDNEHEIQSLQATLQKLDRKIDSAHRSGNNRDLERKEKVLNDKDKYIQSLLRKLGDYQDTSPLASSSRGISRGNSSPRGDNVDTQLQEYLERLDCEVPVTKLGEGNYLFGTRKIYMKLQNGRLVVRVGGGYMFISEFLETYTDTELKQIESQMNKENVDRYEDLKIYQVSTQGNRRSTDYSPRDFNASMSSRR